MTSSPSSAGPDASSSQTGQPGQPGPAYQPAAPPSGPRVTAEQVRDLGRLRRTVVDRKVAGVAGGIARHLDVDPLIIRVAFVVLTLFGGAGLVVYAACWILLPEDGRQTQPLGLDERSRSVALILAGILGIGLLVGQWDWFWVPGPLILVALVVWLVMSRRNDSPAPAPGTPPPPPSVPNAGPDAVTPEQRWAVPPQSSTSYDVPVQQQPSSPESQAQPSYASSVGYAGYEPPPQQGYQPPAPPTYATEYVRPLPRNPRKRGPKLFWFTMALAMLAVGVVGIVDVSGAAVAGSTYPAVVTAVIAFMLLVGSFYGRAGGLILVGLLAAGATGIGLASEEVDADSTTVTPRSASAVLPGYDFAWGEYQLDLSRLRDPEALDGRTITVTGEVGELVVVVPADMDVTVDGTIGGPGGYTLFGQESGGIDTTYSQSFDAGSGVPELTLDLQLDMGHIEVRTQPSQENR
jgi:phage shock protein PspC (stress-responsive transcriptional regulator)